MKEIPNKNSILNSADFDAYKEQHPEARKLKFNPELTQHWQEYLDTILLPLDEELR